MINKIFRKLWVACFIISVAILMYLLFVVVISIKQLTITNNLFKITELIICLFITISIGIDSNSMDVLRRYVEFVEEQNKEQGGN